MKIKDLIERLQKFDPELEVFICDQDSEKVRELLSIEKGIKVDDIIGTKEEIENFEETLKEELANRGLQGPKIDKIIKEHRIELSNSQDVVILNVF